MLRVTGSVPPMGESLNIAEDHVVEKGEGALQRLGTFQGPGGDMDDYGG